MTPGALDPNARRILEARQVVAALREAIARLRLAHRTTDSNDLARTIGDSLTLAVQAHRGAWAALHSLDPVEAQALRLEPEPHWEPRPSKLPGSPALDLEVMGPTYNAQTAGKPAA